jgi:hypothetical protein
MEGAHERERGHDDTPDGDGARTQDGREQSAVTASDGCAEYEQQYGSTVREERDAASQEHRRIGVATRVAFANGSDDCGGAEREE